MTHPLGNIPKPMHKERYFSRWKISADGGFVAKDVLIMLKAHEFAGSLEIDIQTYRTG